MGDPVGIYRLVPGWYLKYRLQRRALFFFWEDVATSDSADELKRIVADCGGFLQGSPVVEPHGTGV